jgi:transposase
LRLVSDEPGAAGEQQGDLVSRLRAAVEARDAENSALRAGLEKVLARLDAALAQAAAEREQRERLEFKVAEVERRLSMDSTDSGTPSSKERIGAKEARRARQQSERERRKDRKRGGQPDHHAYRYPDPGAQPGPGPEPHPEPRSTQHHR